MMPLAEAELAVLILNIQTLTFRLHAIFLR